MCLFETGAVVSEATAGAISAILVVSVSKTLSLRRKLLTTPNPRPNDPHDKFIKQLLSAVLKNFFDSRDSVPVQLAESLVIDVLCKALPRNEGESVDVDPLLGLLARLMAVHPTIIIEHYSGYLSLDGIDSCVLRSGLYWEMNKAQADAAGKTRSTKDSAANRMPLHPDRPFTWILAARCSSNTLGRWEASPAVEFGEGVYWLGPPGLSMGVVEIESLPVSFETVLLRLMGGATTAREAFDAVFRLDSWLNLRNDIIEVAIKHCVYLQQFESDLLTEEALSFMVYIQDVEQAYEEWVRARRAEGKVEGKVEGKIEGKIEGEIALVVKQLTKKVGGLSPDLVARVGLLSLEQVEDLGVALLDFSSVDDLVGWLG
jgi:hypothetical protein